MLLQHKWDGYPLYSPYTRDTLLSLRKLWGLNREVVLATRNRDGEEIIYYTVSVSEVKTATRQEYEKGVF